MDDQNGRSPVYVVLGAAGGIGSELWRQLAEGTGTRLVLGGRDRKILDELAGELETKSRTVELDATDTGAVDGAFERAVCSGASPAWSTVSALFFLSPST